MLRRSLAALVILFSLTIIGRTEEPAMNQENPVVRFARDFSENDKVIVAKTQEFVATPPTDEETIGFYSGDGYSARSRSFLATVSLLSDSGKLMSAEDKYIYELLFTWRDDGLIDLATLPPTAKSVFGPLLNENLGMNEEQAKEYRKTVWNQYAKATEELEEHIRSRGKVLLSVDATDGDTMFFAAVVPEIADRWHDKALAEQDGYRSGVRPPLWDVFWDYLGYAMGLFSDENTGYPRGTRQRINDIPFAK